MLHTIQYTCQLLRKAISHHLILHTNCITGTTRAHSLIKTVHCVHSLHIYHQILARKKITAN